MIYRSRDRGFTLIELVVVLALIAMASALVGVSVGRSRDKAVLGNEASGVRGAMLKARQISLMQRIPVTFSLEADGGAYALSGPRGPLGLRHTLPRKIQADGPEIVFFPKGNSTGGSVTLVDDAARRYLIEVDSVTGSAKLQRL